LPKFKRSHAIVIGISPDDESSHTKFIKKHKLNFSLLTDPKQGSEAPTVCEAYGAWAEKSMYGRKYMGVVRTTYLIGPDGKVLRRWDKVRVAGHADDVLDAVRETAASH
jgi:peroxiredoxin Q/BCP